MESWNFEIDGIYKILEIESKTDGSRILIKMIDTAGGHYGIILETKKRMDLSIMFLEDDSDILFQEDAKEDLCSFRAIRKVNKVNHHKRKEQLIAAYRNAGWMSPELVNIINRVVNNGKV